MFLPGLSTVKAMFDFIIGGLVVGVVVVSYYEGVPIVRDIPFISYIPIVGDLAVGRLQKVSDAAVAGALHEMSIRAENTSMQAQVKEIERQRQVAEDAARMARIRAEKAEKDAADARAKAEAAISADNADDDAARWRRGDIEWLQNH